MLRIQTQHANTKFIDLPFESFLFLRGEYFAFFWICLKVRGVREARWGSKGGPLPPSIGSGSNPHWRRRHMDLVCCWSTLCSERFFSGFSGFPLSLKTSTSKFQFDLEHTDAFQRVLKVLRGQTNYELIQKENKTDQITLKRSSTHEATVWLHLPPPTPTNRLTFLHP